MNGLLYALASSFILGFVGGVLVCMVGLMLLKTNIKGGLKWCF